MPPYLFRSVAGSFIPALVTSVCLAVIALGGLCWPQVSAEASGGPAPAKGKDAARMETMNTDPLAPYVDFFGQVYQKMDVNYYHPLSREIFDQFLVKFQNKIYPEFIKEGQSPQYIKWRGAAYLVDDLKSPDDIFSAFMPPKAAKNYEETVLGKRVDLGIEGRRIPVGYLVTKVEPRSDPFERGLRPRDVIVQIDNAVVSRITDEDLNARLNPLEGAKVAIDYLSFETRQPVHIEVMSKEYFKQTVFMLPLDVPDVYCLQIQRFNRKTSEDLTRYMDFILKRGGDSSLIIDLRGNPGGPPLAAREIASFFLPANQEFAYFKWKSKPPAKLFVPNIPPVFHYPGELVILVDKESGSASELFSGVLQFRGRATVMGTNSAGQVFLKSMFYFDDNSMVLLVTARGHHPDGTVFSYDGVTPDEKVTVPAADLIKYAADYLVQRKAKKSSTENQP